LSVTTRDVADRLGLSITTVSRALAGYGDVAEETRRSVLKIAEEKGYRPNACARRLHTRRAESIGILLPLDPQKASDPFCSLLLAGIAEEARSHGMDLMLSPRAEAEAEHALCERMVLERRVDGLLVVRTRRSDARVAYLLKRGFPFVAFGRTENESRFCYLDLDWTAEIERVVRHLRRLGHRRIALMLPPRDLMSSHFLELGFQKAARETSICVHASIVRHGDLTEQDGYRISEALLTLEDRPTAIIAGNALMALGAISAARSLGLVVGRDVAVIGFGDIPTASYSQPPLTTVRQPIFEIGKQICKMLMQLLKGALGEAQHLLLPSELVIRESCGASLRLRKERRAIS